MHHLEGEDHQLDGGQGRAYQLDGDEGESEASTTRARQTTSTLDRRAYSAIVMMVVLTTLITPLGLKWSLGRRPRSAPPSEPL